MTPLSITIEDQYIQFGFVITTPTGTYTEARVLGPRKLMVAVIALVAVLGAACTGAAEEPASPATTPTFATQIPDLEFGSGEVPFTVPASFPIPDVAVIGTTMIDGVNGRTEMIVNFPANVLEVVEFYETNLPVLGFEITDSKGTETEWDIAHSQDGVVGTIKVTFGGSSLSSGTFTFDHS